MSLLPNEEHNEICLTARDYRLLADEFNVAVTQAIEMVTPPTQPQGLQLGAMIYQFPTQRQSEEFQNLLSPTRMSRKHRRRRTVPTYRLVGLVSTTSAFAGGLIGAFL